MNSTQIILKNILLVLCGFFVVLMLVFIRYMADFLIPIFIAIFTSFMLQPFIIRLQRKKVPMMFSILIVITIFTLIIIVLLMVLAFSIQNFVEDFPEISKGLRTSSLQLLKSLLEFNGINQYIEEQKVINFFVELLSNINISTYMLLTMTKTIDIVKAFFLYIIALIFVLPGMQAVSMRINRAYPTEKSEKIIAVLDSVMSQIQNFITVKALISFITGIVFYLTCLILGVKYALLWGYIGFIFNFIPIFGSIIASLLPIIFYAFESGNIVFLILLIVILVATQQVLGNILEPRIQSQGVNLSPMVIFISLLVWGYILGITGVFLAIPIMSAFNLICDNIEPLRPISLLISSRKSIMKKSLGENA